MKRIFLLIIIIAVTITCNAQDTVRGSVVYTRTDFPRPVGGGYEATENVNGYIVEADVKLFNANGLRGSLAYNFKQAYNVEVYPDYFDGMNVVDLYRNVQTHSAGAQLGYTVKNAVEPFGALFYGSRKYIPQASRQTVRTVRLGVNIPFAKESHFFVKAHLDFEKPYGELPMGFVGPDTQTLGVGAGFRF